jgi:hypothetical protein
LQGDLREVAPGDLRQDLLDTGGEADKEVEPDDEFTTFKL